MDPANDAVFVGMIQRMMGPGTPHFQVLSRSPACPAPVDPG